MSNTSLNIKNNTVYKLPFIKLLNISVFLLIISFLSPYIREPFLIKYDYIILLFTYPILFAEIILNRKSDKLFINLTIFSIILFISYFISDVYGTYKIYQSFHLVFPTEFIQIFNKLFSFYLFYYVIKEKNNFERLIKVSSIVFIIALLIGLSQKLMITGLNEFWVRLYSSAITQDKFILNWGNFRSFGVLGHPIKWSGFALFSLIFFSYLTNKKTQVLGTLLSIINIILAGSKSGIFAGILVFLIIAISFLIRNGGVLKKSTFNFIVLSFFVFSVLIIFTPMFDMIIYRINTAYSILDNNAELGRMKQLSAMFSNMTSLTDYTIGLGKVFLSSKVDYVEIEPFYIWGNYGILGLISHYSLILFLWFSFYIKRKSFMKGFYFFNYSLLGYLLFSFGFYFLREINGGYLFWMITGAVYGNIKVLETKKQV